MILPVQDFTDLDKVIVSGESQEEQIFSELGTAFSVATSCGIQLCPIQTTVHEVLLPLASANPVGLAPSVANVPLSFRPDSTKPGAVTLLFGVIAQLVS